LQHQSANLDVGKELPSSIALELLSDPTTGYAAIQNNVPLVRQLSVTNRGELPLVGIELIVFCSPPFAHGTKLRFERLAPGEQRKIAPLDLQPDHGYLASLDEAEKASITVRASINDAIIAETKRDIEVLAYDQWAGTRSLPELLAAFCMPNSPVVDRILGKASALLRSVDSALTLSGYQAKNRESVWKQISAIYSTLAAENLHYTTPPASFGADGQKIRTPERILEGRIATCLDIAMLFASCLEQAGLHVVVLLQEEHAWVGCWLVESCFSTSIIDDAQAVRKRVKAGELMVFDTTGVAQEEKPSLRWACSKGEDHLNEESLFRYAIDIRRARELQIRALPSKSATLQETLPMDTSNRAPIIEEMPSLPPLDSTALPVSEATEEETPEGRLSKWKSKLLDLTLRNRLLNFRPTKSNLRVIAPDLAALEDKLFEGQEFRIRPQPQLMEGTDPRDATVYKARSGEAPLDVMARDALGRGELIVEVPEEALDARLLEIYRAAETGLEEGGANILFLVFGFLEWKEEKNAEATHLAPILLIPVTLQRQSVRSGFRLARHDDEVIVNPTLIQKLWQDFNLKLPPIDVVPIDDKGIDVGKILQIFRMQVAEIKGWEVKEQAHLGIFSFTKYLMWKDLQERTEQLAKNRVVAHLINNSGEAFANADLFLESGVLDDTHQPQDVFAPLLSDSSQLRAICLASQGKDLVLEGPPGTGKSQTITNLIAHFLATGKSVLFVSEKMAALQVVHRRLNAIGLGPFCLELHSAKAKKAEVLKQLGIALDAAGSRTVKDWELEAKRLATLRQELNVVVRSLHREHRNDLTIFGAMGTCIKFSHWKPAEMTWLDADVHSRVELESLRSVSRRMASLADQLVDVASHPLSAIARSEWSPTWQDNLFKAATELAQSADSLFKTANPLLTRLGLSEQGPSMAEYSSLDKLADALLRAPRVPIGLAKHAHDPSARAKISQLRSHGIERQKAWDTLGGLYREDIARLNASETELEWMHAQTTWWPKNWFSKRNVTGRLRLYRIDQKRPAEPEVSNLLSTVRKLNDEDRVLEAMSADAKTLLEDTYVGHKTDWALVESHEQWASNFADATVLMAGANTSVIEQLRIRLQPIVVEQRAMLAPDASIGAELSRYREAYADFATKLDNVEALAECKEKLTEPREAPAVTQRLCDVLSGWRSASRHLQSWCLWRHVRIEAINQDLQGIVQALESGAAPLAQVSDYFDYSYQSWWVKKAIDREPALCRFASADHERKISEFRQADERFQSLTEEYIAARLAAQIPANTNVSPRSETEMGRLRRELQKQRRRLPVRQLVHGLPTLLPKLKPCLLMSPLSVAQYLDAGHAQFDVVVFDEASQIPVWDAVGAIARGRQLICVGDPKQLPPTNFFNRADDPDAGSVSEEDIQDLESILDECLGSGLPKLSLEWHYRSKHESLIAFSNITYYDGKLVTFPSPVTQDTAVRFEQVNGVYDRGGSRTNRAEAEAIVTAIEKHFLDPNPRPLSLGIVTFNQPQQNLIETLLDARRRSNQTLDQAIANAADEPLFIKNLENVQGDERDLIYFSITHGPDTSGKVSLNFLNREGDHRRLNVAITRARQGVVIFSTLLPEQIDLSRTRATGIRDLKNYLDFALRGARVVVEQTAPTGHEPHSAFEEAVIRALREKGWTVHPQVGVSKYRIDIGVVHPNVQGQYLLGIECDGRNYNSGATARDRDRLRRHVLEGLGWRLHRIWSSDWWKDGGDQIDRLHEVLEGLVTKEETGSSGASAI
jgi:very-short-patch-repair endonuclease